MQAHRLGEVGILGTVSGTTLKIFTEIGSHSTNMEQKISWHSFFSEPRCILLFTVTTVSVIAAVVCVQSP